MNLGEQLAAQNWTEDLGDGELIADAILVTRFTRMDDGTSGVFIAITEGSDIVTVLGLIEAARQINSGDWADGHD